MSLRGKKRKRIVFSPRYDPDTTFGKFSKLERTRAKRRNTKSISTSELSENTLTSLIPDSEPGQLRKISRQRLSTDHVILSTFNMIVTRECERFIAEGRLADGVTDSRDIERLRRRIDDFVLRERKTLETKQRMSLWISLCKLTDLQFRIIDQSPGFEQSSATSTSEAISSRRINDPLRIYASQITNEQLATWMMRNEVFHRSVVHTNADGTAHHSIDQCGTAALWQLILTLKDRWVFLHLSAYVVALVDKLVQRTAFFLSNCEVKPSVGKNGARKKKILGLSRTQWRISSVPTGYGSNNTSTKAIVDNEQTLFTNPEFLRTRHERLGDKDVTILSVNNHFIEETERVLNNMRHELRCYAGFDWHETPEKTKCDCLACQELCDVESQQITEANFDALITNVLCGDPESSSNTRGEMCDEIEDEFREKVWSAYEQPSEREAFCAYNPYDDPLPRSFISRNRHKDSKLYQEKYVDPQVHSAWLKMLETGEDEEPAFALLAALALDTHVGMVTGGVSLMSYVPDVRHSTPFPYEEERHGRKRNVEAEFHREMETTGTFQFISTLLPGNGLVGTSKERSYSHPLIFKMMGSFYIHFKGKMHSCPGGIAQAFSVWVALMCGDVRINGQVSTGKFLFDVYRALYTHRKQSIDSMERAVRERKAESDPTQRILPNVHMQPRKLASAGGAIQF